MTRSMPHLRWTAAGGKEPYPKEFRGGLLWRSGAGAQRGLSKGPLFSKSSVPIPCLENSLGGDFPELPGQGQGTGAACQHTAEARAEGLEGGGHPIYRNWAGGDQAGKWGWESAGLPGALEAAFGFTGTAS